MTLERLEIDALHVFTSTQCEAGKCNKAEDCDGLDARVVGPVFKDDSEDRSQPMEKIGKRRKRDERRAPTQCSSCTGATTHAVCITSHVRCKRGCSDSRSEHRPSSRHRSASGTSIPRRGLLSIVVTCLCSVGMLIRAHHLYLSGARGQRVVRVASCFARNLGLAAYL